MVLAVSSGGGAVVSNRRIASNSVWAGNPAHLVRQNVFFSGDVVHGWSQTETKNNARLDTDKWIYSLNENTKSMTEIDDCLRDADNAVDKLKIIQELLVADNSKDSFFQCLCILGETHGYIREICKKGRLPESVLLNWG